MRVIDIETWPRKEHFKLYKGLEFPHVNITVQVDITDLWTRRAFLDTSPTIALVYIITKAANRLPEMRQRIRGEDVIEHKVVHPTITILGDDDLFGMVSLEFDPDFKTFAAGAESAIEKSKGSAKLDEFPHDADFTRDDVLSISLLPWLAFTGFAITRKPAEDTIPLLLIGKVGQVGDRSHLPFYLSFHHALADGVHAARYVKFIEEEARELAASCN
jgi:chloramphenicol O-acetyltransferase